MQCATCTAGHSNPVDQWVLPLGSCEAEDIREESDQRSSSPSGLVEKPRDFGDQRDENPKWGCLAHLRYDEKLHLSSVWRREAMERGEPWLRRTWVSLVCQKQLGETWMV